MTNFRQPFLSASVPEYWRNWHISLTSWVRDYIFLPLRVRWREHPRFGLALALMIAFLVIGIWHGARWGFVAFGLAHGLLVVGSTLTQKARDGFWAALRMPAWPLRIWRVVFTFTLVMLTLVFNRSESFGDAVEIYRAIFSLNFLRELAHPATWFASTPGHAPIFQVLTSRHSTNLAGNLACVALLVAGDIAVRNGIVLEKFPRLLQWGVYFFGILLILHQWFTAHASPTFVYFKF
jgi:D-alanyl-lipoteichoic acid acyltransferase DltB (MBOAT superfamily)